MDIASGVSLVVGVVACAGVIGVWIKNGKNQSEERGALKKEFEFMNNEIQSEDHGLTAIKRSVDEQKLHCAKVSTSLSERVKSLESNPSKRDGTKTS